MRTSILNRGEIVTQGLEEGGNPGITSLANTFLNLFLDQFYAKYDWPWLLKEASITVSNGGSTIDVSGLSDNFRKVRSIRLDNSTRPLEEWPESFEEFRWKLLSASENGTTGEPIWFMTDPDRSAAQIYVYPPADEAYTGKIWYQYQPAELTDDSDVPVFPSATTLVAAVADFAARYDRDDMLAIVHQNLRWAVRAMRRDRVWGGGRQVTLPFDRTVHNWRTPK